jgi:hypothetical protein
MNPGKINRAGEQIFRKLSWIINRLKGCFWFSMIREGVFVPMEDIRRAVSTAPRRLNGMVGLFNVNPHNSTVNGFRIEMEIKYPKKQTG